MKTVFRVAVLSLFVISVRTGSAASVSTVEGVATSRNESTLTSAADVVISNAWARPALKGGTGGAYMTITNKGASAVQIVSASSPDASAVELHSSTIHDGMAHMDMLPSLEIASGASVSLTPGGKHYMLISLRKALVKGDSTRLQLRLRNGEQIAVSVAVRLQ